MSLILAECGIVSLRPHSDLEYKSFFGVTVPLAVAIDSVRQPGN